jgi:ketosteroid isomerase-like protein
MNLRIVGFSILSFVLGVVLVASITPGVSVVKTGAAMNLQDDRAADREAIRAHIDSIFEAFIRKDAAALRATHAPNWLGYLEGSRTMIKGVNGYMDWNQVDPKSPYGMKSYKMREFDMIFKGDAAFVCFVADVDANTPNGPFHRVLRISDFYTKQNGQWIQNGSDTALHPESVEEQVQTLRPLPDQMKKRLLDAREAVWRAYFANDRAALEKLIPEETIAIESGGNNEWSNRQMIFEGSAEFAKSGGKLLKLEFPKTEIQVYGNTAVVYSNYAYELEAGGQPFNQSGRVTEIFVLRKGQWVNPGWHMDSGK